MSQRQKSILCLVVTALLWSSGGLWIKSVDWNPMAIAGGRSLIAALTIFLFIRRFPRLKNQYQWGAVLSYVATVILFVIANRLTTAANAILLQSTAPIYIALCAPWFLKDEKVHGYDWICNAAVVVGMILFFKEDLNFTQFKGNIAGILAGFSFAWFILFMRKSRGHDLLGPILYGNILTALIGLPFMLEPMGSGQSWVYLSLLGFFQLGIPYLIYTYAVQHVPAIDTIFILLLEPILNPIWVFLFMGETPSHWALIGGAIVLLSVTLRNLWVIKTRSVVK